MQLFDSNYFYKWFYNAGISTTFAGMGDKSTVYDFLNQNYKTYFKNFKNVGSFFAATTDYMRFGLTKLAQSDTIRETY